METESESGKRLTAADVNEMAQALDDGTRISHKVGETTPTHGAVPVDPTGSGDVQSLPDARQQTNGDNPLEAEEQEARVGTFPPDIAPSAEIGGTPEEQAALREEYRHQ